MTPPPVTEPRRAFRSFAEHVSVLARTPEGRRLATRIAPARGGPSVADLGELLARRDADGGPAALVVERLATEAPTDPLAALALLSMLRSDLEVMSARLVHSGRIDAAEAEADTLAAAWEVVTRRPPPRRWERRDVIWNEVRRVSGLRRRCRLEFVALSEALDVTENGHDPIERWPGLLAAAVAADVLTPRELVLIARTRMEGATLREVATSLGRPYVATKKERGRAEATLRTFARRYASGGPS